MKINIFDKSSIGLFSPYSGIESIDSILREIGHSKDFTTKKARREGLLVLNELFDLELIDVFHWGSYEKELKDIELPNSIKMILIQELWFIGADFVDLTNTPMFKYKDWYITKLEKLGMSHTTDWENFVKNKIGSIEKWIMENKPK